MGVDGPIPTKVMCILFTINGVRIEALVNVIRIYEDICKPYRTAMVNIVDNNNVINLLDIKGGEDVTFIVIADDDNPKNRGGYSASMRILKIIKQKPNYGLRTNYYTLELIDFTYFGDRKNIVQESINGQVGTDAIAMIHGKYVGGSPLEILTPSLGLIGQENPYMINSQKPFTAIDELRKLLTFAAYPSGVNNYFHDNTDVKFAALEYLIDNATPASHFIQRATWGANWQDIFILQNGIFASETTTTENQGRSVVDKSATDNLQRMVRNLFSGTLPFLQAAPGGGTGGLQNFINMDSRQIKAENTRNTPKVNAFKARVGDGIRLTVKVPCQTGFNVTVGGGFSTEMQPPAGDFELPIVDSYLSGTYLCIKLVHDLHFDEELLQGTSSIEGLKQE